MTKNKSGNIKISALSDKEYFKLRKQVVSQVNKSSNQTIADVAVENHIGTSTLWGWCMEDLGPNQFKWVKERSQKLATQRAVATRAAKKSTPTFSNPVPVPAAQVPHKNKPWDKKKAREQSPEHQATVKAAFEAIMGQVPPAPKTLGELMKREQINHVKTPHKELMEKLAKKCCKTQDACCKETSAINTPAVAINLDSNGKFISYNVTGEVNVLVFSERIVTKV
jgi:hypothetical protein